ncbi:MAG: hypothetical protein KIT10_03065 [Flavobacteriales bacterium]|nr:hypothetical protein [Flavobacteriales bacterium]
MKMKMDGATIVVGIIVLAMLTLPFVLDTIRRRKKASHLLHALRSLALQQQCKVDQHAVVGDMALGMDKTRNILFYFSDLEEPPAAQRVDLAEIRACQAVKEKAGKRSADATALPDRVELALLPKAKGGSETRLVLFQATLGVAVNGEVRIAEEWAKLINDRLVN